MFNDRLRLKPTVDTGICLLKNIAEHASGPIDRVIDFFAATASFPIVKKGQREKAARIRSVRDDITKLKWPRACATPSLRP